jgi:Xaa-Pro aminopeptidase
MTKVDALRAEMAKLNYDAYIIPSSDPHQSEYVADFYKARTWISDFTGSMANAIVTKNHAGVWTDARYFLQAEQELENSPFVLHKMLVQASSEHFDWLVENTAEGSTVGCDGMLFTVGQIRSLEAKLATKNIRLEYTEDLIAKVWKEGRAAIAQKRIFEHDVKYAGRTRSQKLASVRVKMKTQNADFHLISTLDDIGWLFNLRGYDVACNPVFYAYAVVGHDAAWLFINGKKVSTELRNTLETDGINVMPYDDISKFLEKIDNEKTISIDINATSIFLYNKIKNKKIVEGDNIPMLLKAIKNEVETANIRNAMVKDGVALTKAFRWLEQTLPKRSVSEAEFAVKLSFFRSRQALYYGESFDAIVGYKGNGAIIHYRPEEGKCAQIENNGVLLVDSGGQYQDGTTDITRTIALSEPTAEEKKAYTLVLKGHISLAMAKFPAGTKGIQLDTLARQHLWQHGLNYGHGTGHGVGCFMNVHEPQQGFVSGINARGTTVHEVGMLSSNEPGYYKENAFGIRIENLMIVKNAEKINDVQFLDFENVTYFPIDTRLIEKSLFLPHERQWLNDYHALVLEKLLPQLSPAEQGWLKRKCKKF